VRLARGIEDRDCPVTVKLDFEDPIRESNGAFALSAIIGGTKVGNAVFGISLKRVNQLQKTRLSDAWIGCSDM